MTRSSDDADPVLAVVHSPDGSGSAQTISPAASGARTIPVTHMIVSFNSTSLLLPESYAQGSAEPQSQTVSAHPGEDPSLG